MPKLQGIIDRFEEDKAVIIGNKGQKIILPKSALEPTIKEGDEIEINLDMKKITTSRQKEKVKKLLNKILKPRPE